MLRRLVGSSSRVVRSRVVGSALGLLGGSSLLASLDGSLVVPSETVFGVGSLVGSSVLPVGRKGKDKEG